MVTPAKASSRGLPDIALRAAGPADARLLHRWRNEPSIRRFQPLGTVTMTELEGELLRQDPASLYRQRGERFQWIVLADDRAAGWVTLVITSWRHGLAEIGYALTTPLQRRGVMTAALGLLLDDLFLHTPLERIEARCTIDNLASRRVLEKCGFRLEGLLRGYFVLEGRRVDNCLYALLRGDAARPDSGVGAR